MIGWFILFNKGQMFFFASFFLRNTINTLIYRSLLDWKVLTCLNSRFALGFRHHEIHDSRCEILGFKGRRWSTAYELPMDNSGESMQRHFSIFFLGGSLIKFRVVNEECPICPSETTQFGDSDRGTSNWLVGIYRDFLADSFWKDMNQWSILYLLAMAGKSVRHDFLRSFGNKVMFDYPLVN
jgi:hypothetical protein